MMTMETDRELLIRIDERVGVMSKALEDNSSYLKELESKHDIRLSYLEKNAITKGSITYIVSLCGGIIGIIAGSLMILSRVRSLVEVNLPAIVAVIDGFFTKFI